MTKKKRAHPDVEEILQRPWCYYCERDFDDLKILINHQKAKHFKCERCGRRLNTAGGLSVHMSQVHKENLTAVDNALPNRAGLDIEIFGMEGIPEDIITQHNQRVLTSYHQQEAERRAASGSSIAGAAAGNASKKPRLENPSDLKARLAAHKAKLAEQQQGGSNSGASTPAESGQTQSLSTASPSNTQSQTHYAPPPSASFSQPPAYAQALAPAPMQNFQHVPVVYGQASPSPFQQHQTNGYPPHVASPFHPQPPVNGFSPPNMAPFQHQPQGYPHQPMPMPPFSNQPGFQQAPHYGPPQPQQPPQYDPRWPSHGLHQNGHQFYGPPGGPPRPFGAGSPIQPFPHNQFPQRSHTPTQNASFPQRSGSGSLPAAPSLPPAPSLPQRPAVAPPPVQNWQNLHSSQGPAHQLPSSNGHHAFLPQPPVFTPTPTATHEPPQSNSIDELVSDAYKAVDETLSKQQPPANGEPTEQKVATEAPPTHNSIQTPVVGVTAKEQATEDKSVKKEKEKSKSTRLVYTFDISPEEKMASLPKYKAYVRS